LKNIRKKNIIAKTPVLNIYIIKIKNKFEYSTKRNLNKKIEKEQ
jgi:hypothetical protein